MKLSFPYVLTCSQRCNANSLFLPFCIVHSQRHVTQPPFDILSLQYFFVNKGFRQNILRREQERKIGR
jgi:hypothetical protein